MLVFADSYPAEIKGVFTLGGMSDLDDVAFGYEGVDGFAYRGTPASSSHLDLPDRDYTLHIRDSIVDDAENVLFGAAQSHLR